MLTRMWIHPKPHYRMVWHVFILLPNMMALKLHKGWLKRVVPLTPRTRLAYLLPPSNFCAHFDPLCTPTPQHITLTHFPWLSHQFGNTALHIACKEDSARVEQLLRQKGGDNLSLLKNKVKLKIVYIFLWIFQPVLFWFKYSDAS